MPELFTFDSYDENARHLKVVFEYRREELNVLFQLTGQLIENEYIQSLERNIKAA